MDDVGSIRLKEAIRLIKDYLVKKQDLSVVDLGCGTGNFLFGLFDDPDLKFHLMEGVDVWQDDRYTPSDCDLNIEYNKQEDCKQKGKSNFVSIQADLKKFLFKKKTDYDLIILSNILHCYQLDQIKIIISKCLNLLSSIGIIYIKMANEQHPYADQKDKTVFSEKFMTELQQDFAIIHLNNSDSHAHFIIN